ncbi:MAG: c-type cytochrome [Gammaproteobacteria bacterium]
MRTSIRIANNLIGVAVTAGLALSAQAAEPAAAASSGASGAAAFNNNCRTCHSAKDGDNRLGPSLSKIVGAKAGTRSGYANYSQAMKSSGVTWDEATLDRFIANPEEVVPNNNMKPFKGVEDAAVRKSIIESLKAG